ESERKGNGPRQVKRTTWLAAILKNVVKEKLRYFGRKKREKAAERPLPRDSNASALESPQTSPGSRAGRNEFRHRLTQAIAALPENHRTAVVQFYFEGKTLSQIGASLGQATSTISNWIAKAEAQLKDALQEFGGSSAGGRQ